jgi:hypothetical protein
MDRPNTDELTVAAISADIAITTAITRLERVAYQLRSLERAVAAHPAGAEYRDDIASGEVWPDDDDDNVELDDDAAEEFVTRIIRRLPFRVTGL